MKNDPSEELNWEDGWAALNIDARLSRVADRNLTVDCDACVGQLISGILRGSINFYERLSCEVVRGRSVLNGIAINRNGNDCRLRRK